jgi:NAD-specific glutamate dehydrogenase
MSQTAKVDLKQIAKIYFQIRDRFYIARITDLISKHDSADQIGRLANDYLENELRLLTRELTLAQIKAEKSSDVVSDNPEFIADIGRLEKYDSYVKKMLHETNAENNYLIVQILIKKLQDLLNSSC